MITIRIVAAVFNNEGEDSTGGEHKFWKIDEWEKMTGLKIGQDLLDTMIITPPPPPKAKAKAAKPAQEKPAKATKPPKAAKTKPAQVAPATQPPPPAVLTRAA